MVRIHLTSYIWHCVPQVACSLGLGEAVGESPFWFTVVCTFRPGCFKGCAFSASQFVGLYSAEDEERPIVRSLCREWCFVQGASSIVFAYFFPVVLLLLCSCVFFFRFFFFNQLHRGIVLGLCASSQKYGWGFPIMIGLFLWCFSRLGGKRRHHACGRTAESRRNYVVSGETIHTKLGHWRDHTRDSKEREREKGGGGGSPMVRKWPIVIPLLVLNEGCSATM